MCSGCDACAHSRTCVSALRRLALRLIKLKGGEVAVKAAADATAGVKLESANMMVARVSDSIIDFLLLMLFLYQMFWVWYQ